MFSAQINNIFEGLAEKKRHKNNERIYFQKKKKFQHQDFTPCDAKSMFSDAYPTANLFG